MKSPSERMREFRKRHPDRKKSIHLKWKYGITLDQWNQMFQDQNGLCLICKTDKPTGSGWHTDHDHVTGKVRGILCNNCNIGLGAYRDNPELLRKAADYLERVTF